MTQHITVTAELPANPETPTITYYQERAGEFLKALEQISVAIPQVDPAQYASAKITRGKLRVPDQFCMTAIVAVEAIPGLRGVGTLDPVAARDAMQLYEAFLPVADKFKAFWDNLRAALNLKKVSVAVPALQAYHVAKRLLRDNPTPELKVIVETLKRDLDLRRPTEAEKEDKKTLAALKAAAAQKKEVQKTA